LYAFFNIHLAIFDSHALFTDMVTSPSDYLNGTAPLNVTGAVRSCIYQDHATSGSCTEVEGTDRDSYLWYTPRFSFSYYYAQVLMFVSGTMNCIPANRRIGGLRSKLLRSSKVKTTSGLLGFHNSGNRFLPRESSQNHVVR
jgi:hypothetical protein